MWRHHFTAWLYKDTPAVLEGIVEADETYFRISRKGCRNLKRKAHKRGGDDAVRGLSKKQVCVLTACDRSQHGLEFITGLGPVKGKWLELMLTKRIAAYAVLVTDGRPSYTQFCSKEHIDHVIVKNNITRAQLKEREAQAEAERLQRLKEREKQLQERQNNDLNDLLLGL